MRGILLRPQDTLPRPLTPEQTGGLPSDLENSPLRRYGHIRYTAGTQNTTNSFLQWQDYKRVYNVSGDTILCTRMEGAAAVYMKLGEGNPYIPIREGDVILRSFNKITVLAPQPSLDELGGNSNQLAVCVAEFYYSFGPLLIPRPVSYGIRPPFVVQVGSATVGGVKLEPPAGSPGLSRSTFGSRGGTLLLKNDDNANTLFVGYSTDRGFDSNATGMSIEPKQTLPLVFDRRMIRPSRAGSAGNADFGMAIWVFTTAGTCAFRALFSDNEVDLADLEQPTAWTGEPLG